tara:strand:+ start:48144 stop:50429 length:2286 start_codon:yes stop_codon:yes gene_type:complete
MKNYGAKTPAQRVGAAGLLLQSLVAASVSVAVSQPSLAQSSDVLLEEVLVTAQRRGEQNLQDVPISISAFGAHELNQSGINTIVELQRSAPNVTLEPTRGTNSTLTAFIRGVGQQDPLWGFEPGVGVYLDDVYIARPQGAVLDVYDVEQIEILRGPQGTLYGKNTIGGAIKYTPKRLSGETGAAVTLTAGNYDQFDAIVSGQTALRKDVYFGAAIASYYHDGYGELLTLGEDNYNKEVVTGRANIEWQVSDKLTLRLAYDRTKDTSNPKGGHRMTVGAITGAPVLNDVFDSRAGVGDDSEVKTQGGALHIDYQLDDALELRSISAYRDGSSDGPIDFDNLASNDFDVPGSLKDHQYSQEFQLLYNRDSWSALTGLYYFNGESSGRFDAILGQSVPGSVIGLPMPYIPLIQTTTGTAKTRSASVFSDVTYTINPEWAITVGGRYTYDKKQGEVFSEQFGSLSGNPDDHDIPVATLSDYHNDETFSKVTPRLVGTYTFNEDSMTYLSYSSGFKSGGFDMRGNQLANPDTVNGFDPETVDTYEIGLKSQLLDNRLRVNLAAFYSDYSDMQVVTAVGYQTNAILGATVPVQNVENVGKATLQGVELESLAQLTESWSLKVNAGYINTNIDKWETADPTNPGQFIDVANERDIQNTPEWTGIVALAYDAGLDGIGGVHFDVSGSYRDSVIMFEQPSPIDESGYWLLNANIVWYSPNEHWTIGLHGKNLTDKEYRVAGYYFPTTGEGEVIGYYGAPRTVAIRAEFAF